MRQVAKLESLRVFLCVCVCVCRFFFTIPGRRALPLTNDEKDS